ncbi:MAG: glycosyl hydrolase family 18 protein [Cytophagaceae bacterium]
MKNFNLNLKATLASLILILVVAATSFSQGSEFKVVGYMPAWTGTANSIQYTKLTHIMYSFAIPDVNGKLKPLQNTSKLQQIVTNAHAVGTKVFIACGGWSENGEVLKSRFDGIVSNETYRSNMVNDLLNLVDQYNLDGVDMDYEYPDAARSLYFADLMSELSDGLHLRNKQLSAAVYHSGNTANHIINEVFDYVDFLNIMAYDAGTPHSSYTLAVNTMNYWTNRGLAKEKIILGVPFYGRDPYTSYRTIVTNPNNPANAHELDQIGNVHYNGIPTIKKKTQLAHEKGGGIMIWELTMDATGDKSLLTAIYDEKKVLLSTSEEAKLKQAIDIYPNPNEGQFYISTGQFPNLKAQIINNTGEKVAEYYLSQEDNLIDLSSNTNGIYLIKISNETTSTSFKISINK